LIYLHNTRDLAHCKAIKLDDLRVWAGLVSMLDYDLEIPPKGMISKRCSIRTGVVSKSLKTLTENGFLLETNVNPKYASFESMGQGSVPFSLNHLKEFSRNRTLYLAGMRVLYYLFGGIRRDNKVFDTNITEISEVLQSDRASTSKNIKQLKNENFLVAVNPEKGEKHFVISRSTLGLLKRR